MPAGLGNDKAALSDRCAVVGWWVATFKARFFIAPAICSDMVSKVCGDVE